MDPTAQAAFEQLTTLFSSGPVLAHSNSDLQFIVEVDASDSGAGAVLSQ